MNLAKATITKKQIDALNAVKVAMNDVTKSTINACLALADVKMIETEDFKFADVAEQVELTYNIKKSMVSQMVGAGLFLIDYAACAEYRTLPYTKLYILRRIENADKTYVPTFEIAKDCSRQDLLDLLRRAQGIELDTETEAEGLAETEAEGLAETEAEALAETEAEALAYAEEKEAFLNYFFIEYKDCIEKADLDTLKFYLNR